MDNILNINNPGYLAKIIAGHFKNKRLSLNITQEDLAKKAGVSLGSLKRFENSAQISLSNLLKIAVILDLGEFFYGISQIEEQQSIEQVLKSKISKKRKRARKNV